MQLTTVILFAACFVFANARAIDFLADLKDGSGDTPPRDCPPPRGFETYKSYENVEEFEKCSPYLLPEFARKYYVFAASRMITKRLNRIAYTRLTILPRILHDVSNLDMRTTVLGSPVSFPIGASPVAYQRFASPQGELETARALDAAGTLMILSCAATVALEEVAEAAPNSVKWMQTYIFRPRQETMQLIRRAERAGYKAIVVTVDSPINGGQTHEREGVYVKNQMGLKPVNFGNVSIDSSLTFSDLAWLVNQTKLPVVAKGILTPHDALRAAATGCSAILVSNHGGRQLDSVPATIDVLPGIVEALQVRYPKVEVYLDGGVRNGYDVFKALARGARMVLLGRPQIWGLAAGGEKGVAKVFEILKDELSEVMKLSGVENMHSFEKSMVQADEKFSVPLPYV